MWLLILIPAFMWLGYETDWLTVRLMVGDMPETIIEFEYKDWEEVIDWAAWNKLTYGATTPMCMDWIKNTPQVVPVYHIELYYGNGYRQNITLKNPGGNTLKQVIKVNTGKKYFQKLALAN